MQKFLLLFLLLFSSLTSAADVSNFNTTVISKDGSGTSWAASPTHPLPVDASGTTQPIRFETSAFSTSTSALGSGATWTSATFDSVTLGHTFLSYSARSVTQLSVIFDESSDGVNWVAVDTYIVPLGGANYSTHKLAARYGRVRIVNSATANAGGIANFSIYVSSSPIGAETDVSFVDQLGNHLGAYNYYNVSTAGTVTLKTTSGVLHALCTNTLVNGATITVYDSLTAAAPIILTMAPPNSSANLNCMVFDAQFSTGLTFVTVGTGNWTLLYN